jgi:hypothetical protein
MRRDLADANQRLAERGAEAEKVRHELTAVRSELAAARDIATAALTSPNSDAEFAPEAPGRVAWLTSALQFLGLRMSAFRDANMLGSERAA